MPLILNPIIMKETGQDVLDYFSVEWDNVLLSPNTNTEKLYKAFLEKFESLLDTYAPLKKILKIN